MEDLPEFRMTESEVDMTTLGDIRADVDVFSRHEHVLIGLTLAGEYRDEV